MPRGSKPKRGTPGKNRTIRVPDPLWEKFRRAAEQRGVSVADLLIEAGLKRLRGPAGRGSR